MYSKSLGWGSTYQTPGSYPQSRQPETIGIRKLSVVSIFDLEFRHIGSGES